MNSTYISTGRKVIASGVFGILADGALIGYLTSFGTRRADVMLWIHNVCFILQLLFLIPLVITFCKQIYPKPSARALLNLGIGSICVTILFLLLGIFKVIKDFLFWFPQGFFGVWLIVTCWRLKSLLPKWIKWFGITTGIGFILVGVFPLGYALFVDSIILHIPPPSDEVMGKIPISPANIVMHYILWLGSFMGKLMLPFWSLLTGLKLSRIK